LQHHFNTNQTPFEQQAYERQQTRISAASGASPPRSSLLPVSAVCCLLPVSAVCCLLPVSTIRVLSLLLY
jgi:hypothetical protein